MRECTCEPETLADGSLKREHECGCYPWCPHETGPYSCLMPCRCPCDACRGLSAAAAQPPAPITAEDVRAAEELWRAIRPISTERAAFVADYLNRRGER